ncbi:MAG: carboxypeptidase-like regulatory domain-containing protein [Candidatus Cyclobacteriaceae bacterium M2_1C_046]
MNINLRNIFLILLLFPSWAFAQQGITLTGKIVDEETKEPLPFASIGLKGKPISTVSNLQGEFDFHIPVKYRDEMLTISMLGYIDISGPVNQLIGRDSIIFTMTKAAQLLNEVVVKDSLNAEEILRIAISRINVNHPNEPYLMEGFYRDLKKLGGTYFSILEAAVKIYDENYEEPKNKFRLRERVSLEEVRKSLGYDNKFTRFFDQTNLLEDLLLHNPIKYRHFPDDKAFYSSLRRTSNTYYNGHQVYVIKQIRGPKLTLYIDTRTYAFLRVENSIDYEDLILKKSKDLYSMFQNKKLILDFKEYQGIMYPSYMKVISKINWYDNNTSELMFETELYQELLINKIIPNPDIRISGLKKMRKYGLQYQDLPYNHDFWKNYNVIKQTPLDKEIIADLERQGALPEETGNY